LVNPATRFYSWKGNDGEVVYYDKDRQENVKVKTPFKFLVLDVLVSAAGGKTVNGAYHGYWSNAVRNTKHQQLVVRSKDGVVARGYYEDIKGKEGIKFQQLIYIAYQGADKQMQIGCLKLSGAAVGAWFEYRKAHRDVYSGAIKITGRSEPLKNGTVTYYAPVFEADPNVSDEVNQQAVELDKHLQEYLTAYFANSGIEEVEQEYTATYDDDPVHRGPDINSEPDEYDTVGW